MVPSILQVILVLALGYVFVHFLAAGSRTFTQGGDDDVGSILAQVSFGFTGAAPALFVGLFVVPINLGNGITAAVLLVCALALYEWARHVIWGHNFYLAWSGCAPDALVDEGPYAYIRHPIYTSYILAFLAVLVAMPILPMLLIFILNAALFAHAAMSDERHLMSSALAAEYAEYKRRTGVFLPRIIGGRSTKRDAN
jgi:protein-S-isoprenylcysteine O-methyltransferase Ste14